MHQLNYQNYFQGSHQNSLPQVYHHINESNGNSVSSQAKGAKIIAFFLYFQVNVQPQFTLYSLYLYMILLCKRKLIISKIIFKEAIRIVCRKFIITFINQTVIQCHHRPLASK